jgi:hypothetical protein
MILPPPETSPPIPTPIPAPVAAHDDEQAVVSTSQLESQSAALLDFGLARFRSRVAERHLELPPHGSWEVAAYVSGAAAGLPANLAFLEGLLSSNPNYTGWPVWLDVSTDSRREGGRCGQRF